mmetsp:Transcript_87943/g.269076  ORF Transcript_87943/g.269076 Transcript_87943/m.269076 type:complete len:210 (-) Transcript_87943:133-762(-)
MRSPDVALWMWHKSTAPSVRIRCPSAENAVCAKFRKFRSLRDHEGLTPHKILVTPSRPTTLSKLRTRCPRGDQTTCCIPYLLPGGGSIRSRALRSGQLHNTQARVVQVIALLPSGENDALANPPGATGPSMGPRVVMLQRLALHTATVPSRRTSNAIPLSFGDHAAARTPGPSIACHASKVFGSLLVCVSSSMNIVFSFFFPEPLRRVP